MNKLTKKQFYEMLSEIHNEVADMSCGCMGSNYTPEKVELDATHEQDYNNPKEVIDGRVYPTYVKKDVPSDYIGNIIKKYIKVEYE